ncbi:MAG: DUF1045 domain-containing protein [Alphaproteobacteria bacterium]|nr:DUF1045 domain-containing protein [Alphaproteobacteria bacterium]
MSRRIALYFAPASGSALAEFGARWLGRDALEDRALAQPRLVGIAPERLTAITASPRHYGFHATLKPPFALSAGQSAQAVHRAAAAFARRQPAFALPALRLVSLGGFLALVPAAPSRQLRLLADACVVEFDGFRARPGAAELTRRRASGLSQRQDALLARWGYPFVLEEYRFHLTLTERLAEPERTQVLHALAPLCEPFCQSPLGIDALTLFEQTERARDFVISARYPFAG